MSANGEPPLRPLLVPAGIALMLVSISLARPVSESPGLVSSLQIAAGLLLAATLGIAALAHRSGRVLRIRFVPVRAHWVQILMHASLYAGWAPFFPAVVEHVPHIATQILFYYAFDLLLSWSRRDEARTGFGPIPIVGSVNLFLWFRDDWFLLQFAMLAAGVVAKEFLVWEREGRRSHVFNPSSFPLFLVCTALWIGGGDGLTFAGEIAGTQGEVPYGWLGIFLLALVVQSLFAVTLVTLGALVSLYLANAVFTAWTGVYAWVDVGIPVAVYLGCHFLITDPATSPRTERGRAVFGALYGLAVFVLYVWLREVGGPAYYDKLLCVPFLNLLVRRLDRLGGALAGGSKNLAHVGGAVLLYLFFIRTGFLGESHPGQRIAFWEQACSESRWHGCEAQASLLEQACHAGEWPRCGQYARLQEAGTGVPRDRADAGYHYTLACQRGVDSACAAIPRFRVEGGDDALREACNAGRGLSCLVLGTLETGTLGGPVDAAGAEARFHRACELDVPEACEFLDARAVAEPGR